MFTLSSFVFKTSEMIQSSKAISEKTAKYNYAIENRQTEIKELEPLYTKECNMSHEIPPGCCILFPISEKMRKLEGNIKEVESSINLCKLTKLKLDKKVESRLFLLSFLGIKLP